MARVFIKWAIIYLISWIIVSYAIGLGDLFNNNLLTRNFLQDLYKSITYYFGWVLFYWWPYVLGDSVLMSLITTCLVYLYRKIKSRRIQHNSR